MEPEEKTIVCEKCQKPIRAPNFIIHEAMCRGSRQSFVLGGLNKLRSKESRSEFDNMEEHKQEPPIQPQKKPEPPIVQYPKLHEPEKKQTIFQNPNIGQQHKPQKPQQTTQPKPQQTKQPSTQPPVQQPIKPTTQPATKPATQPTTEPKPPKKTTPPEPQQKFRCTDCGYMMTMKQLDSHPNECPARQKKCQYCGLQFPHYLMEMHLEVCEKSPNRRQQQQRRPSSQRQQIRQQLQRRQREEEQQRNRARQPRGTRQGHIPNNIVPVSTQTYVTRQGNNRVTVRRVMDQNGRVYEERYRQPIHEQPQEDEDTGYNIIVPISMGRMGSGGIDVIDLNEMFSGGNGFEQIIRRLMQNMGVNRQQNPGLTKEQIAKLPVVKFDAANTKSTSCTICMTDFEKGDQAIKLPCGHLFNPQCLIPWLKNSSVCPNCRAKVNPS